MSGKKIWVIILIALTLLCIWFFYANRNSKNLTFRQKLLKAAYPLLIIFSPKKQGNKPADNTIIKAPVNIYDYIVTLNNGTSLPLSSFKGKKLLLVNTASHCGYTPQYDALEKISVQYKNNLAVIAFPANDFKEQEPEDDAAIAQFCSINYNISFPIAQKSSVIKGAYQNQVFQWLSNPQLNGWNNKEPDWNFCKFLIDEQGNLMATFPSATTPDAKEIINAINQ